MNFKKTINYILYKSKELYSQDKIPKHNLSLKTYQSLILHIFNKINSYSSKITSNESKEIDIELLEYIKELDNFIYLINEIALLYITYQNTKEEFPSEEEIIILASIVYKELKNTPNGYRNYKMF